MRSQLAVVCLLVLCALRTQAQQPNPDALSGVAGTPDSGALDFAPIDFATLELGVGAALRADPVHTSLDLRAGLVGASAAFLGLRAQALRFAVVGRPGVHTSSLHAELLTLDTWMIGAGHSDSSPCLAWPFTLCDESTGFVGLAGSVLGVQHDMPHPRTALRMGEVGLVLSATPAFAARWSKDRLLGRLGTSLDHFWLGSARERWRARLMVGVDGSWQAGPLQIGPMFRVRPSWTDMTHDYGIEAALALTYKSRWHGCDAAGDALNVQLQIGYAYWSEPAYAYGVDALPASKHSAFVRVVLMPSFVSVLPPGNT